MRLRLILLCSASLFAVHGLPPALLAQESASFSSSAASSSFGEAAEVEPLDAWISVSSLNLFSVGAGSSTPASLASSSAAAADFYNYYEDSYVTETEDAELPVAFDAAGKEAEEHKDQVKVQRDVRLTKAEQKMLERVRRRIYRRGYHFQQRIAQQNFRDRRGERELRLCTMNLNVFGLPAELSKIAKGESKAVGRDRAAVTAIRAAECDVVALQGLVAREVASAQAILDRIVDRLERPGEKKSADEPAVSGASIPWAGYLGGADRGFGYNAFLVRDGEIQVVGQESGQEWLLPRYEIFKLKKFARGPLALTLHLPGREGKLARQMYLLNFSLREDVARPKTTKQPITTVDAEVLRLQMAEGIRQIIERQKNTNSAEPPIIVALGDRDNFRKSASAQVLEGRLRLRDFKAEGACKLEPPDKAVCTEVAKLGVVFFGVLESSYHNNLSIYRTPLSQLKQPKNSERFNRVSPKGELLTDIFLLQEDLPLVLEHQDYEGHYAVGYQKLSNGLKESPLLWVDFNW